MIRIGLNIYINVQDTGVPGVRVTGSLDPMGETEVPVPGVWPCHRLKPRHHEAFLWSVHSDDGRSLSRRLHAPAGESTAQVRPCLQCK